MSSEQKSYRQPVIFANLWSYISKRSPPLKKALVGGALNVGVTEPMTRCQRKMEPNEAEDDDTRR